MQIDNFVSEYIAFIHALAMINVAICVTKRLSYISLQLLFHLLVHLGPVNGGLQIHLESPP